MTRSSPTDATPPPDPETLDAFLGKPRKPWWRRNLRWLVAAVVLTVLALLLSRCLGGPGAAQYATQQVRRGALQVTVSATGRLEPTDQVQVGSEQSGIVTRVLVDVNDRVTAGQVIAMIDPSRFTDAVRQSQAQLAANRAAVGQAQATLAQDRAQLGRLEEVYRLSGGKVPADTDLAAGRAEYSRAQAALKAAQANVAAATPALSTSRTNLVKTLIRSPVNGVVLARQIQPGQTVAASFNTPTLFVIARDLSRMKLPVAIDEADVGEVEAGQRATFTVDAFPGEQFSATIEPDCCPEFDREQLGNHVAVISYEADLAVANPDLRLRPGMTATAEIVTKARPDVLLVPNAALRFKPEGGSGTSGQSGGFASTLTPHRPRTSSELSRPEAVHRRGARQTVYGLDAGKPKAIEVETGVSDGTMTEIIRGTLRPGMQVITGQLASGGG
ncbi:MAG: efflux RND transporter periplasmic adaptor subunit [Novosphingobium sp.]